MLRFDHPFLMLEFRRRVSGIVPLQSVAGQAAAGFALAILAVHWALIVRFLVARAGSLSFLRLHYSVAFGVDWVDQWWLLFLFPLLGLATFAINLWLSVQLARSRPALGTMLLVATALLEALFAAGGSFAILLNS